VKIYDGAIASLSNTTVEGSAMHALKVFNGGTANASSSTFKTSDYGLELFGTWGPGSASFTDCTFTENQVGAVISSGGTLGATGCQFVDNAFEGAYCLAGSDVTLAEASVSENAIGVRADGCSPELTDATVSENGSGLIGDGQSVMSLRRTKIWSNAVGLELINDASADMDACDGSCPSTCADANSIKLNDLYHVYNDTENWLDAECNYWGGTAPGHAKLFGYVDYVPYLTTNPLLTFDLPEVLPEAYGLRQNYPNPFNPTTVVAFDVPSPGGVVTIKVFDVAGHLVKTLVSGHKPAGRFGTTWTGGDDRGVPVASGVYFLDMVAPAFHATRKIILIK